MDYIVEIVKVIKDSEIQKLGNGLDELLFYKEGRAIVEHLLVKHPKTNIYSPSLWASFKPAVIRYIKSEHLNSRQLKDIAKSLHITTRTLKSALIEDGELNAK